MRRSAAVVMPVNSRRSAIRRRRDEKPGRAASARSSRDGALGVVRSRRKRRALRSVVGGYLAEGRPQRALEWLDRHRELRGDERLKSLLAIELEVLTASQDFDRIRSVLDLL